MSRKLTTSEFIERARAIHGDRYDYSQVVYVNRTTPVKIICLKHGEFWQKPCVHVGLKSGCPVCGREAQLETNLIKYGVPVSSQAECVKVKARATNRVLYGGDGPQCDPGVRAKSVETLQSRYGIENPMGSQVFREKIRQTHQARYGADWPAQVPEIRAKQTETCEDRYGGRSPLCDPCVKAKAEASMLERYGVKTPMQSEAIRRAAESNLRIYGVDHPMKDDSVKARMLETKAEHGTFSGSEPEDMAYSMLCEKFGESDVIRQYRSDTYPFACDFYVRSLDAYIELNISWTHGGRFFDKTRQEDLDQLHDWEQKAVKSRFYASAIETWTVRDVRKREAAMTNGLNYLVFWRQDLADFVAWLDGIGDERVKEDGEA